ncbi:hypothetical protein AVEN_215243-1 [Araneus ventricosus]|uniref:Uncharacterized protein n=1 Tax=Araneus ventricosus TaxID=182803 RepID=A0A4Y2NH50_ARAVE|nr:hypothetical protein AVEN_156556-1 [Araneus ventricosus]GBN38130.1 hypothetical protein AVEN_215243-1 [Araneus ventricosus]
MLAEWSHTPTVLGISTGKSLLESDQVNVEATLGNHHTRLFVPRISPPGAGSDSDKEAADMSYDHQQMKRSAPLNFWKIDDIMPIPQQLLTKRNLQKS